MQRILFTAMMNTPWLLIGVSQEITMELWRPRFASTAVRKQTGLV